MILDALRKRAADSPDRIAYRELADGAALTYGDLAARVRSEAADLRAVLAPGSRLALARTPGVGWISGFLAVLAAGMVAVPVPSGRRTERHTNLADHPVVRDSGAAGALTDGALVRLPVRDADDPPEPPADLALLQYTSGSTGRPKGVMVTHANLAHNLAAIVDGLGLTPADRGLVWLPPYHDMGLIGGVLAPLAVGFPMTLMRPSAFAAKPSRWLTAIDAVRATVSGGPDFGYALCVSHGSAPDLAGVDLSSWRVAFTGAEPIRASTLDSFASAYAAYGFRWEAFYPCYGLAEATLIVTGGRRGAGPRVADLDVDGQPRRLVGCGRALGAQQVQVIDPATEAPRAEGEIGEIVVRGASVSPGYWGRPVESSGSGTWLRTGDLGCLLAGELFVTGRRADTIVRRGRNLYPADIEAAAVASHRALRPFAAAFAVEQADTESLVVLVEARQGTEVGPAELVAAVTGAVTEDIGVRPDAVVLVRAGGLPLTTSGKVRRAACRALYLAGALPVLAADEPPGVDASRRTELTRRVLLDADNGERGRLLADALLRWMTALVGPSAARRADAGLVRAGLDSLALAQLQGQLEDRLGVRVSLAELWQAPSLTAVVALVSARLTAPGGTAGSPAPAAAGLTPGQQAIWYVEQARPGTPAHLLIRGLRLAPGVDVDRLATAVRALGDRHPALRTTVTDLDGAPVPHVRTDPPELEIVPAEEWSEVDIAAFCDTHLRRPFDLATEHPVRSWLLTRGDLGHLLLVAVHHIAVDGWSARLLLRELGELYDGGPAALDHRPAPGPADRLAWHRALLDSSEGDRLRRFWRDMLSGAPGRLSLPTDRPRPASLGHGAGTVVRHVAGPRRDMLAERAKDLNCTPFCLLLAGFAVLLARHTNERDLVIGVPAAARSGERWTDLVGFLATPLPLRINLTDCWTFAEAVHHVRDVVTAGLDHQELPLPALVEAVGGARGADPGLPADALFVLHQRVAGTDAGLPALALGAAGERVRIGTLSAETLGNTTEGTEVPLTLEIAETPTGLRAALRYAMDLFDPATAGMLLDHYATVLTAALDDPAGPIGRLPLTRRVDRAPTPGSAGEPVRSLHHQILDRAARVPDAVAVRHGDTAVTYRDLVSRAAGVAALLTAEGIRPEDRVGVALPRDPGLVAALLGVLMAGGAYVPLDPELPVARLAAMVADAEPLLVLAGPAETPRLPAGTRVVDPNRADRAAPGHLPDVAPDRLTCLLFTSGSTGRPKAVASTHRGITALAAWSARTWSAAERAEVLAGTTISFDLAAFELFVTLANGGTVVLADSVLDLPRLPSARQVTLVNTVPSVARELLHAGLPDSVRTVNTAGERLPEKLAAELGAYGARRVVNLYGPTESTVYATGGAVEPDGRWVSLGAPVTGTSAWVAEPDGSAAAPGVPGELWLAGSGLARGYFRRPRQTAERFVPSPLVPGARAYRTGDLARRQPDGRLVFLGRTDHQVKIRGVRIELADIETAVAAHPLVAEVAVTVVKLGRPDAELVAVVVARNTTLPVSALRAHACTLLPSAFVPARWELVDTLPRDARGKIDRDALRALSTSAGKRESVPDPPRSPAEIAVGRVWSAVLGTDAGVDDDFFTAGGHSLLALRLLARLADEFGARVTLAAFLRQPTIRALAAALEASTPEGTRSAGTGVPAPASPVEPVAGTERIPASFAQEGFWVLDRLRDGLPIYTVSACVELRGALDVDRLRAALDALVARHESLRTTLPAPGGVPVQRVAPPGPVRLDVVDAIDVDEFVRRPFDLANGPLWRVVLLRAGPTEHRLVVALHHAICDAYSLRRLADDLSAAYRNGPAALGTNQAAVSCADVARAQRDRLAAGGYADDLAWWRSWLAEASPMAPPTDRPPSARPAGGGAVLDFALPADLVSGVDGAAARAGVTRFMALTAVLQVVLSRLGGETRFTIGVPVDRRTTPELAEVVGCLVDTVVLPADLDGTPTGHELLHRVRDTTADALDHLVPFELLARTVDPGGGPLFHVLLAQQRTAAIDLALPGISARLRPLHTGTARCALTVLVDDAPSGAVDIRLEYDTGLYNADTMARFAARFRRLAAALAADDRTPVTELPLLLPGELADLRVLGTGPWLRQPPWPGLHERILAQAARTPDRVAVAAADGQLSYRELARRTLRVAAALRARGIAAEQRVAVGLPRTAILVPAILGVLATGAAYLPVSAEDPAARRERVCRKANVDLLLTDRALRDRIVPPGVPTACVDTPEFGSGSIAAVAVDPDQAAYVLFTSGSTGEPKGVVLTHGTVGALLSWAESAFTLAELAGVLASTALTFDLSIFELFAPLVTGGTVVLAGSVLDLPALPDAPRVTLLNTIPSAVAGLADVADPGRPPSSVRTVCLAGEPLSTEVAARVAEWPGVTRVLNLYGPTEDTTYTTAAEITDAFDVTAGRPLPGKRTTIVDDRTRPVPAGVLGEILLGGRGLARGYLNDPAQTAARFVPDREVRGARAYHTGDLGRWHGDRLMLHGRTDHQVKIRGHRVELGEVEAALAAQPGVTDAAVGLWSGGLIAYLAAEPRPALAELRAGLSRALPAYMLPSRFTILPALPRTSSGKVDRAALGRLPDQGEAVTTGGTAIRPGTEEILAGLWTELLDLRPEHREERFFVLGGHSLLAARLLTQVRATFAVELSLGAIFDDDSLAGMAELIDRAAAAAECADDVAALVAEIEGMTDEQVRHDLADKPEGA